MVSVGPTVDSCHRLHKPSRIWLLIVYHRSPDLRLFCDICDGIPNDSIWHMIINILGDPVGHFSSLISYPDLFSLSIFIVHFLQQQNHLSFSSPQIRPGNDPVLRRGKLVKTGPKPGKSLMLTFQNWTKVVWLSVCRHVKNKPIMLIAWYWPLLWPDW